MQWSTEPFLQAHAALQCAQDVAAVESALNPIQEDLRALLTTPPKSESSRSKLATKQLQIDGSETRVNDTFINDSARAADELQLDELVAAQLVFYAASDSRRLKVPAFQAAITMFYVRRSLIIDILRFSTESLPSNLLSLVYPKTSGLLPHLLGAFQQIERSLEALNEKVKASEFTGMQIDADLIILQRKFLVKEHQSLGQLLTSYLKVNGMNEQDPTSLKEFMTHIASVPVFDARVTAYFPGLVAWLGHQPTQKFTDAAFDIFKPSSSIKWRLSYWQSGIALVVMTFLAIEDRELPTNVSFTELADSTKHAIDSGALEMWLALVSETTSISSLPTSASLMRARVPMLSNKQFIILESVALDMRNACKLISTEFITGQADVLKEMRLSEEDMYLAMRASEDSTLPPPGIDLERFFVFVAISYWDGDGRHFFEEGGALHGFLVWASDCQIAFASATFAEILAALSGDCSDQLHELLLSGQMALSWDSILKLISHDGNITEDTMLVTNSYLELISRVAKHSDAARALLKSSDIVTLLFRLLKLQQPVAASVLKALSAFAAPDMWPALDSAIYGKMDVVLTSVQDVLDFVRLLTELTGRSSEQNFENIKHYVHFVLETVLTWAAQNSNGLETHLSCVEFIQALLRHSELKSSVEKACTHTPVYTALLKPLQTQLDVLNELGENSLEAQLIISTIKVCGELMGTLDQPLLYNLHVVPSIAMYAGARFPELAQFSVKLLNQLLVSPEFRATTGRQNRVLSILLSSSETLKIRVGLIGRLGDRETPLEYKRLLLQTLLSDLQHSRSPKPYMSLAHYLLGFQKSELGLDLSLELDTGVGGIATDASLMHVVCKEITKCLKGGDGAVLRLSTAVVEHLVQDPLTSELLLGYLRPSGFWLVTMALEGEAAVRTINMIGYNEHEQSEKSMPERESISDLYAHRAAILTIWRLEIQSCHRQNLLTIGHHYIEALVPIIFKLIDFREISHSEVELQCLRAWCDFIPTLLATGNELTGISFVCRAIESLVPVLPLYARQNTELARPVAALLVMLFAEFEKKGTDYALLRSTLSIFAAALHSVQPALSNELLRADLYTLCVQFLGVGIANHEIAKSAHEIIEQDGLSVVRAACDDVFNSLNDHLIFQSLRFLQLCTKLSRTVDSPMVTTLLVRRNFVAVLLKEVIEPKLIRKQTSKLSLEIVALSLILAVSQTRSGAVDLLASGFVELADKNIERLEADTMLIVLEILATMLISLGAHNVEFSSRIKSFIENHQTLILDFFEADEKADAPIQTNSIVKCFTVLVSLTQ